MGGVCVCIENTFYRENILRAEDVCVRELYVCDVYVCVSRGLGPGIRQGEHWASVSILIMISLWRAR